MFVHSASDSRIFNPYRHLSVSGEKPAAAGAADAKADNKDVREPAKATPTGKTLSEEELRQLTTLRTRDREVRAHEAAHMAAAGGLATGGASYTYQRGPDGVSYAIGGEVNIDTSAVPGDPAATISKAATIKRAALAPADPSAQDLQIAAAADQMQAQAEVDFNMGTTKSGLAAVKAYASAEAQDTVSRSPFRVTA